LLERSPATWETGREIVRDRRRHHRETRSASQILPALVRVHDHFPVRSVVRRLGFWSLHLERYLDPLLGVLLHEPLLVPYHAAGLAHLL
jgi:hypothetical protein